VTIRPRYSREEFARRGDEIYESEIVSRLGPDDDGKFVLIDIETGSYEVDRDEVVASDRLLSRLPDAQVWFRQVGSRYAHRFDPHRRKGSMV
jgi:ABC-type branched-subunit amino acid transport system ATPase component